MSTIALQLTNDLAVPVSLNVLGGTSDESNQNNADTLYEWNLSSETFVNVDTVIIQSRLRGQTIYQNSSTTVSNLSVQGVANALSTLNLGNFLANGNIVYTYNSDIEFADITLTLTNIPQPSGYTQLLYDHFVPVGTVLRQFVYPTVESFESDFGPAITLLFQQTDAATGIDTYGPGCVYPIQGVDENGFVGTPFQISLNPIPGQSKPLAQQPILSGSFGTLQAYNFAYPTVPQNASNMFLYFPSGNINEMNSLTFYGRNGYIFYFDIAYWGGMSNFVNIDARKRMTTQGMLDSLASQLTQFGYWAEGPLTYPSGWTAPAINSNVFYTFQLDDNSGIQAAQTFENPNDFGYYVINANTVIEGYYNIKFNPSSILSQPFGYSQLIQYCNGVILGSNMNYIFTNLDGTSSNTFNMGFSNDNVSWENTGGGLRWNGYGNIILNGINLTAFPSITEMNRYQNTAPLDRFQVNLNLSGNNLPVNQVNQILVDLNQNATSGKTVFLASTINLSGQIPSAPPSGAGITAKTLLISKGITVITD